MVRTVVAFKTLPEMISAWLDDSESRRALLLGTAPFSHPRAYHSDTIPKNMQSYETLLKSVDAIALTGEAPDLYGEAPLEYFEALEKVLVESELFHPKGDWKNTLENLFRLGGSADISCLEGVFKGQAAVLCGAGGSTVKERVALLRAKERAFLIGVGTGATLLDSLGIEPHLRVCIDPNRITAAKALMQHSLHTPYAMDGRLHPQVRFAIQGECLYAPQLQRTLEQRLGYELGRGGVLSNCGPSSGTYAIALARFLGFSKIILVGYDFAKIKGEKYPAAPLIHPALSGSGGETVVAVGETTLQHLKELSWIQGSGVINASNLDWSAKGVENRSLSEAVSGLPEIDPDLELHRALQIPSKPYFRKALEEQLGKVLSEQKELLNEITGLQRALEKEGWHESETKKILRKSEQRRLLGRLTSSLGYTLLEPYDRLFCSCLEAKNRVWGEAPSLLPRLKMLKYLIRSLVEALGEVKLPKEPTLTFSTPPDWRLALKGEKKAQRVVGREGETLAFITPHVRVKFDRLERLYSIERTKENRRHGEQQWFYPSGKVRLISHYKEGLPDGEFTLYYPDGKIKRRFNFVEGSRSGNESVWNEDGELLYSHDF